mgnify:CR=1 FL=1
MNDFQNAIATQTGAEIGNPTDANDEMVGFFKVNQRNGRRVSANDAFLEPVIHRPNLDVMTECEIDKLGMDKTNTRIVDIHFKPSRNVFKAPVEVGNSVVILSAGSVNSPNILQRSGIGDSRMLSENSIMSRVDLKGVGKNLQVSEASHSFCSVFWTVSGTIAELKKDALGQTCHLVQF